MSIDLKWLRNSGSLYNCIIYKLYTPISNPKFREKSMIKGGKDGILGVSNLFFGKNTRCI